MTEKVTWPACASRGWSFRRPPALQQDRTLAPDSQVDRTVRIDGLRVHGVPPCETADVAAVAVDLCEVGGHLRVRER